MLKVTATRLSASIELTPKQLTSGKIEPAGLFPRGTRVYLTDLGPETADEQLNAAKMLQELAYVPVPHFAARRIPSRQELERRISRLSREAGVDDVLVIAGGMDQPAGPFADSLELLETGILQDHGVTKIAIAGHPEGSPDIAPDAVDVALMKKNEFAARTGLDVKIATQFLFDVDAVTAWLTHIEALGNTLPVHLGVAGPTKITTLLKYATMCGVGPSIRFLKKNTSSIVALATSFSPDAVVEPLEAWAMENPGNQLAQFHVFPFGGVAKTSDWLHDSGSWSATTGEAQYSPWNAFEVTEQ